MLSHEKCSCLDFLSPKSVDRLFSSRNSERVSKIPVLASSPRVKLLLSAKLVVHLPSTVLFDELFTVEGLSATNFLAGNCSQHQYIGCYKVIIMMDDSKLNG